MVQLQFLLLPQHTHTCLPHESIWISNSLLLPWLINTNFTQRVLVFGRGCHLLLPLLLPHVRQQYLPSYIHPLPTTNNATNPPTLPVLSLMLVRFGRSLKENSIPGFHSPPMVTKPTASRDNGKGFLTISKDFFQTIAPVKFQFALAMFLTIGVGASVKLSLDAQRYVIVVQPLHSTQPNPL